MFNSVLKSAIVALLFCSSLLGADKPQLLFYCGITMVKPMQLIASQFEKNNNCTVKIIQGGSEDLYDSLKLSKTGDLYLPGLDKYIKEYKKDGFFKTEAYVGFNQAAIFVKKGNPKKIKNLESLINPKIGVVLCNPDSGSIGKATKALIISYKDENFFNRAFDAALEIGTDSRSLNASLLKPEIDMTINWKASGETIESLNHITMINIPEKYAPKQNLVLTTLSFSKNQDLAKKFVNYASSKDGAMIMKRYGFR